jgi:hypothetical protein
LQFRPRALDHALVPLKARRGSRIPAYLSYRNNQI